MPSSFLLNLHATFCLPLDRPGDVVLMHPVVHTSGQSVQREKGERKMGDSTLVFGKKGKREALWDRRLHSIGASLPALREG